MKTILITGASSGIGKACAQRLAHNNRLILCSRNRSELDKIASTIENALVFKTDVRNDSDIQEMFKVLEKSNMRPDVLINAAGCALGLEELEHGRTTDWDVMIDTNIKGLLIMSKYVLLHMKTVNRGHIINIGSIAGIVPYSRGIVYSATKSAVKAISDGLRKEVVTYNIKVTNVQPGLVETNFSNVRFHGDEILAKKPYEGIVPLTGTDIADIVEYVLKLPDHVQINEITVTPVHQATVEIIHREI